MSEKLRRTLHFSVQETPHVHTMYIQTTCMYASCTATHDRINPCRRPRALRPRAAGPTTSGATRIRAPAGEVLPLHAESGGTRAARGAAAVRAQPVVRGQHHRRRRRLPVPLPLVDEPVVDLLRVQPRRLRQRRLLQLLHASMAARRRH